MNGVFYVCCTISLFSIVNMLVSLYKINKVDSTQILYVGSTIQSDLNIQFEIHRREGTTCFALNSEIRQNPDQYIISLLQIVQVKDHKEQKKITREWCFNLNPVYHCLSF